MNAGLPDGTTTGDLVLQQAKIVPQTQHFFDFSHGQSLLGHSVSPLARGEIPIACPAPLSAPTQKARSRNVNINSGSDRLFHRGSDYSHPRNLYSHARNPHSHPPGIFIHIAPESTFTCPGIRTGWLTATIFDAISMILLYRKPRRPLPNSQQIGFATSLPLKYRSKPSNR